MAFYDRDEGSLGLCPWQNRGGGVALALALGKETGGRAQLVSLVLFQREPDAPARAQGWTNLERWEAFLTSQSSVGAIYPLAIS